MNTQILMTICAIALGSAGILLSFLPQEVAYAFGGADTPGILLQLLGALYFGFAMVNWTAKANLIGGIYGRPVTIGNFAHFLIGALALLRVAIGNPVALPVVILTLVYAVFALIFGYILFMHPGVKAK